MRETAIVCSLGAGDLEDHLEEIESLGADSLVSHVRDGGGRHLLCFRDDAGARRRLEQIVAVETRCCPFLDIALERDGTQLLLTIAGPADAEPVAGQLALTFASGRPGPRCDAAPGP